jgi:Ca-activated chloride channel family protein
VKLKPTPAHERETVLAALDDLESGGSTAGGEGIRLAYSLAEKSFRKDGVNRIVLATDGDFNVGIHEPRRLRDFVSRKRKTGVFLTVLGFGLGNYRDTMMQTLAQAGNGMAAYIDNIKEARRVLVDDVLSSLVTVARDVKFQIEFNPERVAEYRLIGYETRLLKRTDFNNDRVDSGDIGAGHTVTALYELTLVGGDTLSYPLRYARKKTEGTVNAEFAFLRIRFKVKGDDRSKLIERSINESDVITEGDDVPTDARFAAAAAWFAEALRNSPHVPSNWSDIRSFADATVKAGDANERQEFLRLVKVAEEIAGRS